MNILRVLCTYNWFSSVTGYSPDILCMLLSIWAFRLGSPWDFFPFWTFVLHELHEV